MSTEKERGNQHRYKSSGKKDLETVRAQERGMKMDSEKCSIFCSRERRTDNLKAVLRVREVVRERLIKK